MRNQMCFQGVSWISTRVILGKANSLLQKIMEDPVCGPPISLTPTLSPAVGPSKRRIITHSLEVKAPAGVGRTRWLLSQGSLWLSCCVQDCDSRS